jgi:hypothetical protein
LFTFFDRSGSTLAAECHLYLLGLCSSMSFNISDFYWQNLNLFKLFAAGVLQIMRRLRHITTYPAVLLLMSSRFPFRLHTSDFGFASTLLAVQVNSPRQVVNSGNRAETLLNSITTRKDCCHATSISSSELWDACRWQRLLGKMNIIDYQVHR